MKPQFNNQLKEYNLKFDIIFIQFPYHLFTGFRGAINSHGTCPSQAGALRISGAERQLQVEEEEMKVATRETSYC